MGIRGVDGATNHPPLLSGIADCVMTADTELDCLERLDEGTHRFCRLCQRVVARKLVK